MSAEPGVEFLIVCEWMSTGKIRKKYIRRTLIQISVEELQERKDKTIIRPCKNIALPVLRHVLHPVGRAWVKAVIPSIIERFRNYINFKLSTMESDQGLSPYSVNGSVK
jgi:hypothetical protein